jgi:phosphoribosylformimino-5-aminoimidazole carboxamide ribotide isomerase
MIIPVIDILDEIVVHAVAGQRDQYQPLVSRLTTSTNLFNVHQALIPDEKNHPCYIADLNGIKDGVSCESTCQFIQSTRKSLWIDSGIRTIGDCAWIEPFHHVAVVLGTETLDSIDTAIESLKRLGTQRAILSIDCFKRLDDSVISSWLDRWQSAGGQHVIWLDIAAIGREGAAPSIDFCDWFQRYPQLSHYPGGGVRDRSDVDRCLASGATGVLVATALHNGSISMTYNG